MRGEVAEWPTAAFRSQKQDNNSNITLSSFYSNQFFPCCIFSWFFFLLSLLARWIWDFKMWALIRSYSLYWWEITKCLCESNCRGRFLTRRNVQLTTWKKNNWICKESFFLFFKLGLFFKFFYVFGILKYFNRLKGESSTLHHRRRTEKETGRGDTLIALLIYFFLQKFPTVFRGLRRLDVDEQLKECFPPLVLETPEQTRCGVPSPRGRSPSLIHIFDAISFRTSTQKPPIFYILNTFYY